MHTPSSGDSELDRARQDNDLLQKKLSKAISKRNYYAKLYYSCTLERDKAMAEREGAVKELQRVLMQLHQQGYILSPISDCPSEASRLFSDSSSGSNPTATPLTPSKSVSLASLLSCFQSLPSTSLHSPVEDSGLCTGGSTSSLATNKSSIEKESLNSSPNDFDTPAPPIVTSHSPLIVPAIRPCKQPQDSDVTNLLAECAEALEGIADLGLESNNSSRSYKQMYEQDFLKKPPRVSPILASTTSLKSRKVISKPVKKDENKFVDTFENVSVQWPQSYRDNRVYTRHDNLDSISTSLLEEYAQDSTSSSWRGVSQQSVEKKYLRNPTSKLDRIEEMSCESSVSDHSSDLKVMEQQIQKSEGFGDSKFSSTLSDRTDSIYSNRNNLSYSNLTTYELRHILFELSTSPDSGSYLKFYTSSFEDEWVLLLLCDEIRRNINLTTLYLVECNLSLVKDGLFQLLTAVCHSKLSFLSLARNGLTDRVVDSFRIIEFFNSRLSLKVLDLSENFLSAESINLLNTLRETSGCDLILHKQYVLKPRSNLQYQLL
ncbi:hypothetical protein LOD99_2315 [Oopsacas minuta]|uniref:Uncharacterized protein n=1 Tax=Oopsacas minuta TaxID=111878 RepID=A0AAV7K1M1_9METZ|nr:hypothetical protein LOD99_2315 [Oopsacas minuta]